MSKTKKMILSALFIALGIVLARFLGFRVVNISFSFSFVTTILSAIWLGPRYSTVIAGLVDLIGALLFPAGPYFVGYTIDSMLSGFIYGVILYQKSGQERSIKEFIIRLLISTLIVSVACNLFLSSLWSYLVYGKAYLIALSAKLPLEAIRYPVKIVTIIVLTRLLNPLKKKYLEEE